MARLSDGRWSKALIEWWPRSSTRGLGLPQPCGFMRHNEHKTVYNGV